MNYTTEICLFIYKYTHMYNSRLQAEGIICSNSHTRSSVGHGSNCAHTHGQINRHTHSVQCISTLHAHNPIQKTTSEYMNTICLSNNTHPRMETGAGDTYWFSPPFGRKGSSTVDPWRLLPSPPVPLSTLLPLFLLFPLFKGRWRESTAFCPASPTLYLPVFSLMCHSLILPLMERCTLWGRRQWGEKKKTLAFPQCSQKKTEQGSRRWKKKMNKLLALALLCTDTGRRGVYVCVYRREIEREREQ